MLKINARKFLNFTTEELWNNLSGEFIVLFQDGEIKTNYKEIVYSSYAWDYHRKYNNTPLLIKHHVKSVIKDKRLSSNTHLDLIGACLWSVYDQYKSSVNDRIALLDDLAKQAYEIVNYLYNDLTYRLESYVTSIDILDFLEVTNHPKIVKSMQDLTADQDSIGICYNEILSVINNPNELEDNALAKTVRSRIVNTNQVLQCVGPRGYITDIDSHQFMKKPIIRGYVHGIRSLYDSMIESRSASKALAYSQETLQSSEYFSRRQQLVCQNLKNLHMGDCGSDQYLTWTVRDAKYEGVTKIRDCDLFTIDGKYYLDEETNTLKIVHVNDKHLINKTIKLRSIVAGCKHPDPYGVCEVCYGETALAIPAKTNLGHAACVSLTEKISQTVLSTKHLDTTAVIEGIVLKPHDKKYLSAPVNGNIYYLNKELHNKNVHLQFSSDSAMRLTDINIVDDIKKINISRMSEIEVITLVISDNKHIDVIPLTVSVNKRLSNLTHDLLLHIKKKGWNISPEGFYDIDMNNWDYSKPILSLPMRHINMGDIQSKFLIRDIGNSISRSKYIIGPSIRNNRMHFFELSGNSR